MDLQSVHRFCCYDTTAPHVLAVGSHECEMSACTWCITGLICRFVYMLVFVLLLITSVFTASLVAMSSSKS